MRSLLIAATAAVLTGAGTSARADALDIWQHLMAAGAEHAGSEHPGHGNADHAAHISQAMQHLYVDLEATDAQKAQIEPLVKQAISDLQPLRAQLQSARDQALQAVTSTPVDRVALEAARTAHLQLADQASKRALQLIADISDVLNPAQRKTLADHLSKL